MSSEPITFGERVRKAREMQGMSASELAGALSVCEETLQRWEMSEYELPDEITRRIIAALDISPSLLYGGIDARKPPAPAPPASPASSTAVSAAPPSPPAEESAKTWSAPERRKRLLWLRDSCATCDTRNICDSCDNGSELLKTERQAWDALTLSARLLETLKNDDFPAKAEDISSLTDNLQQALQLLKRNR